MAKRVFISYAWESGRFRKQVLAFWRFLRLYDVDAHLDMPEADQPRNWAVWMEDQIREADVILCIASLEYKNRAEGPASPDGDRGVRYETRLIRDDLYRNQDNGAEKAVPVVLPGQSVDHVPDFLCSATRTVYYVSDFTPSGAIELLRYLLDQPRFGQIPVGSAPDLERFDPFLTPSDRGFPATPGQPARPGALEVWQEHATADIDADASVLIGVDHIVARLQRAILEPVPGRIVCLTGEGGIGKTAIAYEVACRCAAEGGFTRMAWAAAEATFSIELDQDRARSRSWHDLVRTIGEQLGFEFGPEQSHWPQELADQLRSVSSEERFLVVVDNLESVRGARSVVDQLTEIGLSGRHSILLTTRYSILTRGSSVVEEEIRDLEPGAAVELVRHLGRTDPDLATTDAEGLRAIFAVTMGNPLLIKIVIRRYLHSRLPLDRVLDELTTLGDGRTGRLPADRVKDHLYRQSFEELDRLCGPTDAIALMSAFCVYQKTTRFSYQLLWKRSRIDDQVLFDNALSSACQLALIRPVGALNKREYLIHSLLHEYNCRVPAKRTRRWRW